MQGLLDHVGFTSTNVDDERPALPQKLRALPVPPGFRGTWRIQSLEHRAQLANGSRCGQSWSSRSYTTT